MALTGKRKERFEQALRTKAWQMAEQKRYTSVAIMNLHRIDGLQKDPAILAAIERLKQHRKKLDEI